MIMLFGLSGYDGFAQSEPEVANLSPEGKLEVIFDQFGKQYTLSDIKIKRGRRVKNNLQLANVGTAVVCGYYRLYFEQGCGFQTSAPSAIARRDVLCKVFTDISNFIVSPLVADGNLNTEKVNIWIRNIDELETNAATSQTLGVGSGYYNVPQSIGIGNNGNNLFGGILDTEVWKTIHTGIDSYVNVVLPLITTNNPLPPDAGNFYHGFLAINFNNPNFSWNYDLSTSIVPVNQTDLYSVLLHEITHMLGFRTLIGVNGRSTFPSGYDYFSRYDTFLTLNSNDNFVVRSNGNVPMYNNFYNILSSPTSLQPGTTCPLIPINPLPNDTNCLTNRMLFSLVSNDPSEIVPVFRPDCFQPGSSLSHFEDQPTCFTHIPLTTNDGYFAMSNANPPALAKRFLQDEE